MGNNTKVNVTFENNRIDIISNINLNDNPKKQEKLTAYCIVLCTEGEGELYLNNQLLKIKRGDLMTTTIGSYLQGKVMSEDFRACGFYMTKEYFEELSDIPLGFINATIYVVDNPLMHLSEKAFNIFMQYYNLIRTKLNEDKNFKHNEMVTNYLFQAFMYEFHDIMEVNIENNGFKFSSGEKLYKQFLELVTQSYPKPRSVEWYADKLNVTPKYLSSVTKQCSHKTASAIINHYVLEDVKRSLIRPDKTIKEIVNELDFSSISFFGKYCKKNLGMAPKFYRIEKGENI